MRINTHITCTYIYTYIDAVVCKNQNVVFGCVHRPRMVFLIAMFWKSFKLSKVS